MNRTRNTVVFTLLLLAISTSAFAQAKHWKEIAKPQLRTIQIQQPYRVTLPNGMVVMLQENHELPLITGMAIVRGGTREEPAAKVGMVDIFGQAWRTGGTKAKTGDELDDFLEMRAARVETSASDDSTSVTFDTLKSDFEPVFAVFADLLRNPEFRADKIELAKQQERTGIARRNDDASQIARREGQKIVYGAASPYARVAEYSTINAITREDLFAWHKQYVHPNNIILGISGDFDRKTMEAAIRKAFGSWARGPQAAVAGEAFVETKPGVYFVNKDDVTQSVIQLMHLTDVRRTNPDYVPLLVMNEILGGGMSSRLFTSIRSKQGLAYSVGGGVSIPWDHAGTTGVAMSTKSEGTAAAIEALQKEIADFKKAPPTAAELALAKDALLNSWVFRYDSKDKVLREQMGLELYGAPADFYSKAQDQLKAVSAADVQRVANKYIQSDRMAIVVVGKSAAFDRPLSTFGAVKTLDITIPEGVVAAPAVTGGTTNEARALLSNVARGFGDPAKVAAVKSIRRRANMTMKTPQGDMAMEVDSTEVYPNISRQLMKTPMGEITMIVTPDAAFMTMGGNARDLPGPQKAETLRSIALEPLFLAGRPIAEGITMTVAPRENGSDVLVINSAAGETRWYIDPKANQIVRTISKSTEMGQAVEMTTEYSDFRAVDGITAPFKTTVKRNGEQVATVELLEMQINPTLDPKLLVRPAAPQP